MSLEIAHPSVVVRQLFDHDTWTYSYLLIDPKTRQGVLIDPVKEQINRDLELIKELGVELLYVMETHVHADHVTSAGLIRQKTGAKIVYSEAAEVQAIDVTINDGEVLKFGQKIVKVIATPGHTSSCVSYYIDGTVFSGDALLIHGCGRTDFQQGNAEVLYDSIVNKLFALPDETIVYPGHDYKGLTSSTIGEEKHWNPRIGNNQSKKEFVQIMRNLNLELPKKINEAVPANMEIGIHFDPQRYLHEDFSMQDLYKKWQNLTNDELIVDCRTPEEYKTGHVPNSRNIPFGSEEQFAEELKEYKQVYIYCRSGRRAQTAFMNLSILGLNQLVCVGHSGMPEWVLAGYPSE